MKELYTIAHETQIDLTDFEDMSDCVSHGNGRLPEPPHDPQSAARVAALVRYLEGG